jgi:hypothetical protein
MSAPYLPKRDLSKVRWLASFPKSGNTWVRAFLANLMIDKGRPLTLDELSKIPFYTDTSRTKYAQLEYFGKAHHPYSEERHGTNPAVYIVRDPVDVTISCANFFNVSIDRMHREVARDWPRHVASWLPRTMLVLKYENMPDNFHTLAKTIPVPDDFQSVTTAISRANFRTLKRDEEENGFVEHNSAAKTKFFNKGTVGQGRELMTDRQVARIVNSAGELYTRLGYGDSDE